MVRRWLWFLLGFVVCYLFCGMVVSWSLAMNTAAHGKDSPWWLWFYWTVTWLYQVVEAGLGAAI